MIYCDLSLSGVTIWTGCPCLDGVPLRPTASPGLVAGRLAFLDTQGTSDPTWDGLGTRYQLSWLPDSADLGANIPLRPVPSQQLDVTLGQLTYTISIYENSPS